VVNGTRWWYLPPLHNFSLAMYEQLFETLSFSKNEAKIYETLLRHGELAVGSIAQRSRIHRRNVYDALNRLVERGLVYEVLEHRESWYQAVDPKKLLELLEEKQSALTRVLPELSKLYENVPHAQRVCIYRGVEGWKNYMRDILRVGQDFYCIGAKGAWMDQRVMNFFPRFIAEAGRRRINYFHLFDHEVRAMGHEIVKHVGKNYKFLPPGYSTPAAVDVFGPHVNILSNIHVGGMDDEFWFTVIINQQVADAFRTWFRFMYDFCP
jgi:predicted DNA-binding transcriptional regulator